MKTVLLVAALISLAGCIDPLTPSESRRLHDAEEKWEKAGIRHYEYQMRTSCFCPPEMMEWAIVKVSDGVVVSATALDGTPFTDWGLTSRKTVEELFDQARARYDWLEDIDFEFDETYGYPLVIEHRSKRNVADAGAVYEARNLMPSLTAANAR
jgi:hypothetical protein